MHILTWNQVGDGNGDLFYPIREGLSSPRYALKLANLQKAWAQCKVSTTGVDHVKLQGRLNSTHAWVDIKDFTEDGADATLVLYPELRWVFDCAAGGTAETESTVVTRSGEDDEITWTAKAGYGEEGDNITITLEDPSANDAELEVSVDGWDVTVSLATDGSGTITSTAAEVVAAVAADEDAAALLEGEVTGAGGVCAAVAETNLASGAGTRVQLALGFCEE